MRILLDHCLDWRFGRAFPAHQVRSTRDMGWERLQNGKLLAEAAKQFDVVLTIDRSIKHQQNPAAIPIAVLVILTPTNRLKDLLPFAPAIESALRSLARCELRELSMPSEK